MSEKFIDSAAAAVLLGCNRISISALARSGRIPGAVRVGPVRRGVWQIPLQPDGSILVIRQRKAGAGRKAA
jgi:hypothetical protein